MATTKAVPNEVDRIITEHGRNCPFFLRFFLPQKVSQQLLTKARKSRKKILCLHWTTMKDLHWQDFFSGSCSEKENAISFWSTNSHPFCSKALGNSMWPKYKHYGPKKLILLEGILQATMLKDCKYCSSSTYYLSEIFKAGLRLFAYKALWETSEIVT